MPLPLQDLRRYSREELQNPAIVRWGRGSMFATCQECRFHVSTGEFGFCAKSPGSDHHGAMKSCGLFERR